jgi:hypothetical protein
MRNPEALESGNLEVRVTNNVFMDPFEAVLRGQKWIKEKTASHDSQVPIAPARANARRFMISGGRELPLSQQRGLLPAN